VEAVAVVAAEWAAEWVEVHVGLLVHHAWQTLLHDKPVARERDVGWEAQLLVDLND